MNLKAKLRKRLTLCLSFTLLGGCASHYAGLGPNLYVTEKQEIKEQKERFHLVAPLLPGRMKLGAEYYTDSSLLPILNGVSPEATANLSRGITYKWVGEVIAIVGLSTWYASPESQRCLTCPPVLLMAGGLGLFTYGEWKLQGAVHDYNGRLEQLLTMRKEF